ncbi:hypothetical protein SPACI_056930 [Sporomusa acidovorans DSM 3132]|uniref:Phosphotransferase system enzyme I N-terminal domain-containing protein n=1 Tax=Sporomusa acidovorans (strain ATCC 49682 / DSM 3132 / Mol) TaxID=1123286 RepID=A0ABZ3JCJ5_SPOA4|nr:phosphoenolpyruvate-protein phosphotransferase [Sporomusa acidovorans DSM 3132]SDE79523.1 PEP-utilising enzyme, N-terminal [Sporomusa acidovorans]
MEEILHGTGVVPGIGIGAAKMPSGDLADYLKQYKAETPPGEANRLSAAIQAASAELMRLKAAGLAAGQQNQADIMDAHYTMVNDPALGANISEKIEQGIPAPQAVLAAAEEYAALFDTMPDPYLRERAADIRDVGRQLVRQLVVSGTGHTANRRRAICYLSGCGKAMRSSPMCHPNNGYWRRQALALSYH